MSSICGIFYKNKKPVPPQTVQRMVDALGHWEPDNTGTWAKGSVGMGHLMLFNTPESLNEQLPFHLEEAGLSITADARIDNRDELINMLGLIRTYPPDLPDSRIILKAYMKWGTDCPRYLLGDFAFAVWDAYKRLLFCARDHMGCKPFFFHNSTDSFVFATEMKGFFTLPDVPEKLNEQWVADALSTVIADKEYTPWEDVFRLPPAHCLIVTENSITKSCYWTLDPHKGIKLQNDSAYVEAFREKLFKAVSCRTRSVYPVGSELSGGLDSSAVASIGARESRKSGIKFWSFSHVLPEIGKADAFPFGDEKEFGDKVRQFAGIKNTCYITSEELGLLDVLKQDLRLQDGPVQQQFHNGSAALYQTGQAKGVRTLLSGFGGDELVSSQAGGYLAELAKTRAWLPLWYELSKRKTPKNKPRLQMVKLVSKEYFPLLRKVYNGFVKPYILKQKDHKVQKFKSFAIAPEFAARLEIKQRFMEKKRTGQVDNLKMEQYERIMHPHVPQRMEYCSIASMSRHMEYRYPLMDIRLMEFYLALPSCQKFGNGLGRYMFRRAIEGLVPKEIQWRDNKFGATIPAYHHCFLQDYEEIKNAIQYSEKDVWDRYIDRDGMLRWQKRIKNCYKNPSPPSAGAFRTALMLLLLFEEQSKNQ